MAGAKAAAFKLCLLLLPCVVALHGARSFAQVCTGDCDGDGNVTVDELVTGISIGLGNRELTACESLDTNGDRLITVDELVLSIARVLNSCPATTPISSPSPSPTATATITATPTIDDGAISVDEAVARDSEGIALRLGETVTTAGVVTVDAGVYANSKLKVFAYDSGKAIMIYHQTSAAVETFRRGDLLRVTGVIRQADPTGGDNLHQGTVLVDLTNRSWTVLSSGNALPPAEAISLSELAARGIELTGSLVRVAGLHKVEGDWPRLGDRSSGVMVADDGATAILRFQRPIITSALDAKLQAIGDGTFSAAGIVLQDDPSPGDGLLSGFQLWPRDVEDIAP